MCEVQAKLIAWLDSELPSDEAADVDRHIKECEECRQRLAGYEQVIGSFDLYCEAVLAARTRRRIPSWVPVVASAALAAGLLLASSRAPVEAPPVLIPPITAASVALPATPEVAAPRKIIHKRHPVRPVPVRAAKMQPMETAVQIAIPAEAMFPPGAMPKGLNFIAELSIAADGSVRQVRLRQ